MSWHVRASGQSLPACEHGSVAPATLQPRVRRGQLRVQPQPSGGAVHTATAQMPPATLESHIVSAHPDAVRRRQAALKRKAAAQAEVELATKASWWEGAAPPNLCMASSPAQLRQHIDSVSCLVVADFFSSWCTACRRLYPKLKQIAENNPDVVFVKVNVENESLREMSEAMGISQLPFFQFYKRGELATQFAANLTRVNRIRAEIAANKDCVQNACDVDECSIDDF